MKHEHIQVRYTFEHGDESLPHLKDLVSDIPDPMKWKIMGYLRTHCIILKRIKSKFCVDYYAETSGRGLLNIKRRRLGTCKNSVSGITN